MSIKLTWDDLLIQDITPSEAERWLCEWQFMVSGEFAPVFMSKFGDWFLRRPDGSTDELSVIEGGCTTVARTPEEFAAQVNNQDWQEVHLLSLLVLELHERGLVPGTRQCYALAPHPLFVGKIDLKTAMIMNINVWQSICAQVVSGECLR